MTLIICEIVQSTYSEVISKKELLKCKLVLKNIIVMACTFKEFYNVKKK